MAKLLKYKENPFMNGLAIPVGYKMVGLSEKSGEQKCLINIKTGETEVVAQFTKRRVDGRRFVKVFTEMLAFTDRLSITARKVMEIIQYNLQIKGINRDELYLGQTVLLEFNEWMEGCYLEEGFTDFKSISQSTFTNGLAELVEKAIIARKAGMGGSFWINPKIIYNGDSLLLIEQIERINDKAIADPMLTSDKQKELNYD